MKQLSPTIQSHITTMLLDGKSAHAFSLSRGIHTSTIIRFRKNHFPHLPVSSGGCPPKLSTTNARHGTHLLTSRKVDTAVDATKSLSCIIGQPLSAQTTRRYLKKNVLKAVVKQKKPLLQQSHRQDRLDFALAHQYWTVEDWRRVVWSDETKIHHLGSDGRK